MLKCKHLALIATLVLFTGLVFAADREVRGTVSSIDGASDTLVVRLDNGTTKTFKYASTLDVLNIGQNDYVVVRYNEDASGNLVALEVDETERMGTEGTPAYASRSDDTMNRGGSATNELPRTGSPLPFLTLIGLGSILGGLALRLNVRR